MKPLIFDTFGTGTVCEFFGFPALFLGVSECICGKVFGIKFFLLGVMFA